MPKYKVVSIYDPDIAEHKDPHGYLEYMSPDYDTCSFLLNTETDELVWCDRMEPEDATLSRDLRGLVELLNADA